MNFSAQQLDAIDKAVLWYTEWELKTHDRQVFRLFGYAGTGKTTLARHFAERLKVKTLYACFTGKAAYVMRQRGCVGASTIHSLIYTNHDKSMAALLEMEKKLVELEKGLPSTIIAVEELKEKIEKEQENLKRPVFTLNPDSKLAEADLLIIDEVSMVGETIGKDLLSFGKPILVLGDPAQLPPVADGGFFINKTPDVLLKEIHRQAEGSPILALATAVRRGQPLSLGSYGSSKVVQRGVIKIHEAAQFDQIIVGKNATRHTINNRVRTLVLGRKNPMPEPGDKIVCLRNNHELGLLNGALYSVEEVHDDGSTHIELLIREHLSPDSPPLLVSAHREYFRGEEPPYWSIQDAESFDYGYAITCHKAQGSQWGSVMVVNEGGCFRENAGRWLYTAITRAAERVAVVQV